MNSGLKSFVKHLVIKYWNPEIRRKIEGSNLYIYSRLSHVRTNEDEIVRFANFVFQCEGDLTMIDVGANIGVVTLMTYNSLKKGRYLSIDGNDSFFPFLEKNMKQVPGAECLKVYLSDKSEKKGVETKTFVNTANILESKNGIMTDFITLDEVCTNNNFNPNFLKVDTDGFDTKVLRGFSKHLSSNQNIVIYFEYAPLHQVFNKIENNPTDIFSFLNESGYEDFYFYDENGAFVIHLKPSDEKFLNQLTQYCLSGCKLFNILVFHKSNTRFKEFYETHEQIHITNSIKKLESWWIKR